MDKMLLIQFNKPLCFCLTYSFFCHKSSSSFASTVLNKNHANFVPYKKQNEKGILLLKPSKSYAKLHITMKKYIKPLPRKETVLCFLSFLNFFIFPADGRLADS